MAFSSFNAGTWKKVATGTVILAGAAGGAWWLAGGGSPSGAPTCKLTHPSPTGTALSGTVTLTASCDGTPTNVAFKYDNATINTDSTAPYQISWNTTSILDGTHNLTVVATSLNNGISRVSSQTLVTTSNGVVAQRFVSSSGTNSGDCSVSACATFQYAYSQSNCGDIVQVAGGTYPKQVMADISAKDSACNSSTRVNFQPAPASTVHLTSGAELGCSNPAPTCSSQGTFGPEHIYFQGGFLFDGITDSSKLWVGIQTDDIVWDGTVINGNGVTCDGCGKTSDSSILFKNITASNAAATSSLQNAPFEIQAGGSGGTTYYPNMTIDNMLIHDYSSTNSVLYHIECLIVKASGHVTIQRSTFYNCQLYDISLQAQNTAGDINNVHILQNQLGQAYQSWSSGSGFSNPNATAMDWDQAGHLTGGITSTGDIFAFNATTLECAGCQDASKNLTAYIPELNLNSTDNVTATITGNIGGNGCGNIGTGTLTWNHNLYVAFSAGTGTTNCGTDTLQAWNAGNFGFSASGEPGSGGDFTLTSSSPAKALVPVAECTAALGGSPTDIAGLARPNSNHTSFCNAGPNENV